MKVAALTLAVLLFAACGGAEDPQGAGTPSAPAEPPAATEATATMTDPVATEPSPQKGLPAAVAETRARIIEAAGARDWDALAALIPADGFTFSYGADESAIDYWQDLEAAGEDPLATMAGLLALPYTRAGKIYVWPWAYDVDPASLSSAEKEALAGAGAATVEQLDQMAEFGHYLGWRLGIRRDGTWIFFVAGD